MKKILIVGYTNNMGGLESFILNYYRNINRNEIQFEFLVHYNSIPYQKELEKMGAKIWFVTRKSDNMFKYKREMKKFFEDNAKKYSAIWINICSLSNNDHIKYAKKYKIPKRIIHSHNTNESRGLLRKFAHYFNKNFLPRYATDYWACSNAAGKWFYNNKIMKSNKYKVINNAINVDKFTYNEILSDKYKKELDIKDKFVIGHVGRFCDQKNHDGLIDIFYEYYKFNKDSHLLLIGIGELENSIRQKVKTLGIEENISFLGARDDVNCLMQAMDLFILPSLYEGLPIVGVEAQMAGLPCIFADTITEEIRITKECCFLSLDNLEEWRKEIEKLKGFNKSNITYLKNKEQFDINVQIKNVEKLLIE